MQSLLANTTVSRDYAARSRRNSTAAGAAVRYLTKKILLLMAEAMFRLAGGINRVALDLNELAQRI